MLDLKSSMCRNISNAAKNILKVGITGKELFESIGSLSAPGALREPIDSNSSFQVMILYEKIAQLA